MTRLIKSFTFLFVTVYSYHVHAQNSIKINSDDTQIKISVQSEEKSYSRTYNDVTQISGDSSLIKFSNQLIQEILGENTSVNCKKDAGKNFIRIKSKELDLNIQVDKFKIEIN